MLLTRAEAAERLRVHPHTVDRYIRRGLIKAIKNPGAANAPVRIEEAELVAYLERHQVEPETANV